MQTLDEIMSFDHVILVLPSGAIIENPPGVRAPEVFIECDSDGQVSGDDEATMIAEVDSQGWAMLTGFTGQWGYSGPIMHPSEYIGGRMEDEIRATPGYYACVEVLMPGDSDDESAGWAVVHRELIPAAAR